MKPQSQFLLTHCLPYRIPLPSPRPLSWAALRVPNPLATAIGSVAVAVSTSSDTMAHRPLSPHLGIFRFAYTMALSILHRLTGIALATGLVVLVCWLMALAGGPDSYAAFQGFAGHMAFQILLALWLVAFLYHFANGIRHLFWDAGIGMERAQARRSALIVVVLVVLMSALLLYLLFTKASA